MAKPMHDQAADVWTAMRNNNTSVDAKINLLTDLKSSIKHREVPEAAVPPIFDIVRVTLSSQHSSLVGAGFSTLGHLLKRLNLQEQSHIITTQATKTLPYLVDRLGDHKERHRWLSAQCLTDFWLACPQDVEYSVRNTALAGKNPKAKEVSMQWLTMMSREHGLQFRGFVPRLMDCLEDSDGNVRETAKETVVELFRNSPDHAKSDLKKQLHQRNVRKTIASYILVQLGLAGSAELDLRSSTQLTNGEALSSNPTFGGSVSSDANLVTLPPHETEHVEPAYVNTHRELEDTFREMHPFFEGKENEHNWIRREKSIIKLRKLTKGNAPNEFNTTYIAGVKALLDGILKTVNSLRTTVSSNGCHLIQEIATTIGPGLDSMVEILLRDLIKLCAGTKKISAQNGNTTVDIIMASVTYNIRLMQHLWDAIQDKNVQPRTFATTWLRTVINKHGHHKSHFEHTGGADYSEKCIKRGLADANPGVREGMRSTFWVFAKFWPERAEAIMSTLDEKHKELLEKDAGNPNSPKKSSRTAGLSSGRTATLPRNKTGAPPKPSVREAIAAQKRAAMAAGTLPERPASAQSTASLSPARPSTSISTIRPSVSMASIRPSASRSATTTVPGTLSSAPMRPMRPARRPEVARPATADPYASRKATRVDNPKLSPAVSPNKDKSRTTTPANNTIRGQATSTGSPVMSPVKSTTRKNQRNDSGLGGESFAKFANGMNSRDEDLTMLLPNARMGKGTFRGDEDKVIWSIERSDQLLFKTNGSQTPSSSTDKEDMSPSTLKVYEDPIQNPESEATPRPLHKTNVLEELPVNEPGNIYPAFHGSDGYHGDWKEVEIRETRNFSQERPEELQHLRRLLDSGIARVRARTLDVHGFRKLQGLVKSSLDIWEDGVRFGDLLLALLDCLEISNDGTKPGTGKAQDLKTQVLVTIRTMLNKNRKYFAPFYPRALCALLSARKNYDPTSHIVSGLEETAEDIVSYCRPDECIEAVLNLLETEDRGEMGNRTWTMGLHVLAGLLHNAPQQQTLLPKEEIRRLGKLAVGCLDDLDSEIRRAVVDCSLELHDQVGSKAEFWDIMAGAKEDHRNLITYYIARRDQLQKF
ncbi:MAG: suppressor of tub2 mutation [Candelina submexicana]|nr:MAG: suppressor of tub2 mutation [Candelina submexicana]